MSKNNLCNVDNNWFLKYAKKNDERAFEKVIALPKRVPNSKEKEVVAPKKIRDLVDNLTVKEVAKHLRCNLSYVYEQIRLGHMRTLSYGKRRVVPVTALYEFLDSEKEKINAGAKSG